MSLFATEVYQEDSPGWRFQKGLQQVGEWWEFQWWSSISKTGRDLPPLNLPPWVIYGLFWLIVGVFLLWLGFRIVRVLEPDTKARLLQVRTHSPAMGDDEIDLSSLATWLQRAKDLRDQGHYGEACRALYLAMLQLLDDRRIIPQQKSRTDGEYRYLVQEFPHPRPYLLLLDTHEQFCFRQVPISPDLWEDCHQAMMEIQQP